MMMEIVKEMMSDSSLSLLSSVYEWSHQCFISDEFICGKAVMQFNHIDIMHPNTWTRMAEETVIVEMSLQHHH